METADHIRLVRDALSGVEAIRARFSGHAYDLHRHDEWLVGVTDHGVQDFYCRGARRRSTPGRVILIEPGEMHDGRAGADEGFAYCMLYLPSGFLAESLGERPAQRAGFRATLADDAAFGTAIRRACDRLLQPCERLSRDAALDLMMHRLRRHVGAPVGPASDKPAPVLARRARDRLHDLMVEDIGADGLASAAGAADRFELARAFRAAYGTSPHAYLVQIRLSEARHLLKAGERPAEVAAACGFADQSHLGRWFRRAYGLTPAAYRAGCTDVPDGTAHKA